MAEGKRKRIKAKMNFSEVNGLFRDENDNAFLKIDTGNNVIIVFDMTNELIVTPPADTDKVIDCTFLKYVYEDNFDDD